MSTFNELIYLILDQIKLLSDDSYYTEEHVAFLLKKCRAFILQKTYADVKKVIPSSNFQSICLKLKEVPAISGEPCEGGSYLRSEIKIPSILSIGTPILYPIDFYQGTYISYISRDRMRYVGHNKWLQNIIYASKGPDDYLYLKSSNPQYLYLEQLHMIGIFEDPQEVAEIQCSDNENESCNIWDKEFPLEEALVPTVVELVLKYLLGAAYRPKDSANDASDDLSELMAFMRRNMKSNFQKQLED